MRFVDYNPGVVGRVSLDLGKHGDLHYRAEDIFPFCQKNAQDLDHHNHVEVTRPDRYAEAI